MHVKRWWPYHESSAFTSTLKFLQGSTSRLFYSKLVRNLSMQHGILHKTQRHHCLIQHLIQHLKMQKKWQSRTFVVMVAKGGREPSKELERKEASIRSSSPFRWLQKAHVTLLLASMHNLVYMLQCSLFFQPQLVNHRRLQQGPKILKHISSAFLTPLNSIGIFLLGHFWVQSYVPESPIELSVMGCIT